MRHAYVETRGDKQYRFWFRMEDGTPEKMRLSAMSRRNGSLMDVMQIVRDVNYFNKNHNPGDPIQLDFNYNKDIVERNMPPEYPDSPPGDPDGQPA